MNLGKQARDAHRIPHNFLAEFIRFAVRTAVIQAAACKHATGTQLARNWDATGTQLARNWHATGTRLVTGTVTGFCSNIAANE